MIAVLNILPLPNPPLIKERELVPQGGSQKSKVKSQNEDSIGFWRI
jgi:hypothetical protein